MGYYGMELDWHTGDNGSDDREGAAGGREKGSRGQGQEGQARRGDVKGRGRKKRGDKRRGLQDSFAEEVARLCAADVFDTVRLHGTTCRLIDQLTSPFRASFRLHCFEAL
eukprot:755694-Hanusia_phi.AAC.4